MGIYQGNIYSNSLGMQTQLYACLPQDNEHSRNWSKPKVMILLHGMTDNAFAWVRRTRFEEIVEKYNIAVFMPEVQRSFYHDLNPGCKYFTYVSQELPQIIRRSFNVMTGRDNTMIAGLSMGGYGAMKCALQASENFSKVGAFSAIYKLSELFNLSTEDNEYIPDKQSVFNDLKLLFGEDYKAIDKGNLHRVFLENKDKKNLPNLYICCGKQDPLIESNRTFHNFLDTNGLNHVYEEWEGDHEWRFWSKALENFLALFLKEENNENDN